MRGFLVICTVMLLIVVVAAVVMFLLGRDLSGQLVFGLSIVLYLY